jgi:hypothetical protein
VESGSRRGRQRDPAAIGERGDGEGTAGQWKRVTEMALTGGREDSIARRQCYRLWLALALAAGRGGRGCDGGSFAQEGGETGRERKGGAGAAAFILMGFDCVKQRKGPSLGWHHMAKRWGEAWGRGLARRSGGNGPRPAGVGGAVWSERATTADRRALAIAQGSAGREPVADAWASATLRRRGQSV